MQLGKYINRDSFYRNGGYCEIWKIAYPLIIMGASYIILTLTDRMLLAWHSTLEMAASVPAGGLNFSLFSFYSVTIGFTSALVAQYFGAEDKLNCVHSAWGAIYLSWIFSAIILLVNIPLGRWIILNSGHDAALAELELKFFYSLQPSSCFACMSAALFGFFSGTGRTKIIAKVNTTMCLLNIGIDYILIYGIQGIIPSLGIVGAGLATSLCSTFGCMWAWLEFLKENQQEFPTRHEKNFDLEKIKKIIVFGSPSGLQVLLGSGGFTVFQFMIGYIGNEAITASSILITLNNLAFAPILGFCDATTILSGQYIGRDEKNVAEGVVYSSMRMLIPYITILGILYIFFGDFLIGVFNAINPATDAVIKVNFDDAAKIAKTLMVMAAFTNILDAVRFIFMGGLRGAGDTKAILYIIGLSSCLVMIPGVTILARVYHQGILVLWGFCVFYLLLLSALMFWRYRSGAWKKIDMIKKRGV
ncbi:MAG: MATE family efflux transporter [Lentisphaeria bacterium]|nr:MATE family efflux transporter [Lentisphaeria bacterium]